MNILFVHQNFPGQFLHLAPALARAGHNVHALALAEHQVPGVRVHRYRLPRLADVKPVQTAVEVHTKIVRAEACASHMLQLRQAGFEADLVISNPAWGESMFAKDVFPRSKLVCLLEYFYGLEGGDVGFDREFANPTLRSAVRLRMKNLSLLDALHTMDLGVAPTGWQRSRFPENYLPRIVEIFDGIDTDAIRPDPSARLEIDETISFAPGDPVVTFVSRNLEPYRGYHTFMRALPEFLRRRPEAHVVVVGGDGVSYGAPAPAGKTWKQIFLDEVKDGLGENLARLHFVGMLDRSRFTRLLQVSAAHVYLTYPFVLSWSCLEALSAGCHVIGSATAPVQQYIEHGVNGTLVDFFDAPALAAALDHAVAHRERFGPLREAARRAAVQRCDLQTVALPRWRSALSELMGAPV
jgi:glycosyltransferase involved in cell wall biosynthesis